MGLSAKSRTIPKEGEFCVGLNLLQSSFHCISWQLNYFSLNNGLQQPYLKTQDRSYLNIAF